MLYILKCRKATKTTYEAIPDMPDKLRVIVSQDEKMIDWDEKKLGPKPNVNFSITDRLKSNQT
jgi:hypothetical protein